jgi:hypothetical protein
MQLQVVDMNFLTKLREIFPDQSISEDSNSLGYQIVFEFDELLIPVLIIDERKETLNNDGEIAQVFCDTVMISVVDTLDISIPRKWRRERFLIESKVTMSIDISTHIYFNTLEELAVIDSVDNFIKFLISHRRFLDSDMRLFESETDMFCTGEYYIFNYSRYNYPTPEEFSHNPGRLRLIEDQIVIDVQFPFSIEKFSGIAVDLYDHFIN